MSDSDNGKGASDNGKGAVLDVALPSLPALPKSRSPSPEPRSLPDLPQRRSAISSTQEILDGLSPTSSAALQPSAAPPRALACHYATIDALMAGRDPEDCKSLTVEERVGLAVSLMACGYGVARAAREVLLEPEQLWVRCQKPEVAHAIEQSRRTRNAMLLDRVADKVGGVMDSLSDMAQDTSLKPNHRVAAADSYLDRAGLVKQQEIKGKAPQAVTIELNAFRDRLTHVSSGSLGSLGSSGVGQLGSSGVGQLGSSGVGQLGSAAAPASLRSAGAGIVEAAGAEAGVETGMLPSVVDVDVVGGVAGVAGVVAGSDKEVEDG